MERRLAAILAADVVGYSRLMAADKAGGLDEEWQEPGSVVAQHVVRDCVPQVAPPHFPAIPLRSVPHHPALEPHARGRLVARATKVPRAPRPGPGREAGCIEP